MARLKLLTVLSVYICACVVDSYKILILCPIPVKSNNKQAAAIADILHEGNHEVTFVKGVEGESGKYREIILKHPFLAEDFEQRKDIMKIDNIIKIPVVELIQMMVDLMEVAVDIVFNNEQVKNIMNNEKFDLVIIEYATKHAFTGIGVKFDCPVIMLASVPLVTSLARLTGNPVSPATVPNTYSSFTNQMTFKQRVRNTIMAAIQEAMDLFIGSPLEKKIYEQYLPDESKRVPFSKLEEKISLVFSNTHPSMGFTRPLLPNVVQVGGFHIDENTTLSKEFKDILDNAKHGVIYFSMGGNMKSADFLAEMKADILNSLGNRKELILWKYEDELLSNKPKNIIIKKWMPQLSILKHPNIKLFITHGGLLSTTEAASAGVPVLSIPIFGDQFINAHTTQARDCGLVLEYSNITEASMTWALNEVLGNPKYAKTAKQVQKLFHDRPMSAKNTILFYTEHVIRTGGAKHLSPPRLPLYSLMLLDVFIVILFPVILINMICFRLCKRYCRANKISTSTNKSKKTNKRKIQ